MHQQPDMIEVAAFVFCLVVFLLISKIYQYVILKTDAWKINQLQVVR